VTSVPTRGIDKDTREEYLSRKDEKISSNLRIIRVGSGKQEVKNFTVRALNYGINSYSLYHAAKKIETDVYLISSTPPFLGFAGAFLSKKSLTVYNLQDVFPDSLISSGKASEGSLLVRILRKFERYVYRKQNHIIAISQDYRRLLLEREVSNSKISIIYNWIDEKKVTEIYRNNNKLIKKYKLEQDKFYVTYCGNIGHTQNLEMVIDTAMELEPILPEIRFILIGDGARKSDIEAYIKNKYVKTVKILPFQPYEDISHVMSLGNVSLVCSKPNVSMSSLPSKTWSIMAAGRPVITSFDLDSELCEIVNNAKSGICVPPDDKEALKNAIIYAYNHQDEMIQLGNNAREYIENNLTREVATQRYFDVLTKVNEKNYERGREQ